MQSSVRSNSVVASVAEHSVHTPASGIVVSLLGVLHVSQEMHAAAPALSANLPAPQAVHAPLPVLDLYLPATHAVHALPV